jgi:hypothetical protein
MAAKTGSAGLGVDASGGPVIDPTANVLSLVEAANRRQDDLRMAEQRRIDQNLFYIEHISEIRASHSREMRELETSRLNAIRQVDVTAVKTEADRALAAIQTLAATTQTNAENLRNALTNTAATIATQNAATVSTITERIAALEKFQYEGQGRARVADPQFEAMLVELRSLRTSRDTTGGERRGISSSWLVLLGAVSLISTLMGIAAMIYAFTK